MSVAMVGHLRCVVPMERALLKTASGAAQDDRLTEFGASPTTVY